MCIVNFIGRGYDEVFVKNMFRIVDRLQNSNHEKMIKIVNGCDIICRFCRKLDKNLCNQDFVCRLDSNWLHTLNFKVDDYISNNQLRNQIKLKVNSNVFKKNCKNCEWFNLCFKLMKFS